MGAQATNMVIFENRSAAYFWVREHRERRKHHLQSGMATLDQTLPHLQRDNLPLLAANSRQIANGLAE